MLAVADESFFSSSRMAVLTNGLLSVGVGLLMPKIIASSSEELYCDSASDGIGGDAVATTGTWITSTSVESSAGVAAALMIELAAEELDLC